MSRRKCCCYQTCSVFDDEFGAPHGTDMGSGWTEDVGNWITEDLGGGNEVATIATNGAWLISTAETNTEEQTVSCDIHDVTEGRVYRLGCNAVSSANLHFIEFTPGAASFNLKFYKNAVLLREVTVGTPLEDETTATICISVDSFSVSFNPSPDGAMWYVCNPALISGGKKAGIGNGAASEIHFDSFDMAQFIGNDGAETDDRHCCVQQCMCKDGADEICIPHDLLITWYGTGGCDDPHGALNGQEADLTYDPEAGYWTTGSGKPDCLVLGDFEWILQCDNPDCMSEDPPIANLAFWSDSTDECVKQCEVPLTVQCDPLVITMAPQPYAAFEMGGLCGDVAPPRLPCCESGVDGSWWAVITEAP